MFNCLNEHDMFIEAVHGVLYNIVHATVKNIR